MASYPEGDAFPPREIRKLKNKFINPFGAGNGVNVLEYFLGTPEIVTDVKLILLTNVHIKYSNNASF